MNKKSYAQEPWKSIAKITGLSQIQLQMEMQQDSCSCWNQSWAPNLLQKQMGNKDDESADELLLICQPYLIVYCGFVS